MSRKRLMGPAAVSRCVHGELMHASQKWSLAPECHRAPRHSAGIAEAIRARSAEIEPPSSRASGCAC